MHPWTTRGGPWLLKDLSAQDRAEIKAVAGCAGLQDLFNIAKQFPGMLQFVAKFSIALFSLSMASFPLEYLV